MQMKDQQKLMAQIVDHLEKSTALHEDEIDFIESSSKKNIELHKKNLETIDALFKRLLNSETKIAQIGKQLLILSVLIFGIPAALLTVVLINYLWNLYQKSQPGDQLGVIVSIIIAVIVFFLGRLSKRIN